MNTDMHRRRLENLAAAGAAVKTCARRHMIGEYLAGQVTYNLGEYPKRFSIAPTDYDRKLLAEFARHGVRLIQLHEEWNDSERRLGADKFTSHDPAGLREFVALVHELGMKVILYASTGFFEATDPDFDPAWAAPDLHLIEVYFDYARCSPASPGWRAYLLPRLERILDEYEVDGLYDDLGFYATEKQIPHPSWVSPGRETVEYSPALEDLLGLVLDMVHRRGGVFKVHASGANPPACRLKLYDYLWVGEGVQNLDKMRLATCHFEPYVVPGYDMSRAQVETEDDLYLHAVPFMQFPLRVDGRPFTGERALVPGMNYRRGDNCFWTRHWRSIWQRLQADPNTPPPPMYGCWDSSPGRLEGRPRWLHHFDLYRPMVEPGTHAWIDVADSTLFDTPKPADVTATLFVNTETYLVLANYTRDPVVLPARQAWRDRESGAQTRELRIPPRDLLFLQLPG
ncbi:MAG: hypothetical protein A3K19_19960 [Lentisphaerae bacterium RIFOXYB12_FULL_65_16]|nr:MAG: hypothetical protein A3K18_07240 [Lentisphaerae bacterium RIFOXYA12_64_32]OGV85085.1 MAG: hypothetical protein A3K19_19960 [Lentisphaerae bacterium RIFOXYB12_FULL_65_16]